MINLIKYVPLLRNKMKFIKLIPLRTFNVSQCHLKSHPFQKPSFRVSWTLPSNDKELQPKVVFDFFESIKTIDCVTAEDVKNEKFQTFLNDVQPIIAHQSNGREILEILIGIINNKSLRDHEMNDYVVNAVISKIQDIPFHALAFLDYRIQKLKLNDFYKELRLKIQLNYLLKTDELLDDCKNFKEIKRIFDYMRNNMDIVSPKALNKLAMYLMRMDNNNFTIDDIMNVIVFLSQFNYLSEQSIQTLNKMIELWCERKPQFRDVELLLSLLAVFAKKTNKRTLDDAGLIRFIFKFLNDTGEEKTVGCFTNLIEMGYWQQSIESMSQLFECGIFHSNMDFFVLLCCTCEKYKYRPANWKSTIIPALEQFDFIKHIAYHPHFDWPRFAAELYTFGYSDIDLIEALLKSPKYFNSPMAEKLEDILNESRGFVAEGPGFVKFKNSHRITSRLPSKGDNVTSKDVVEFFQGLSKTKCVRVEDVQKVDFQSFLRQTMEIIRQMAGSEILQVMIGIIHHEQLRKHPVNNCVMNALIAKIRALHFRDMAFLDYLIQRMKLNSTYDRLRLEIQKTFLENVDGILDECKEFETLLMTTVYMRDNTNIVSATVLNRLSHFLILANGDYKIQDIRNVIALYSQFNYLEKQAIEALNKMVQIWCKLNPKIRDVGLLISLFVHNENRNKMDKLAFENSGLIRFIFDYLNESNDPQIIFCFADLIKMGYWHEGIESISKCFEKGIVNSNDVSAYIALCISCEKYNFKPLNWQSTIVPMLKVFDFRPHIMRRKNFNWPLFAVQLHSLGYNDFDLIEALLRLEKFNNSRYLKKLNDILMEKSPNDIYSFNNCFDSKSNLQLMSTLISQKSLQRSVEGIIGREYILCDYEISENFKVPFIVKVDFNEAKFMPINKSKMTESLKTNEKLIGIFVVDDEDKWIQLKELLEMADVGEMDLKFTKIIPDKWLSKQMIVLTNDDRREMLLQNIVEFFRVKVKKNYYRS